VDQAAPTAPRDAARPPPVEYVTKLAPALAAVEAELGLPLDELDRGIRTRLCYELHRFDGDVLEGACLAAARQLSRQRSHLTKPYVWADRAKEAATSLQQAKRSRERERARGAGGEGAPPAPPPEPASEATAAGARLSWEQVRALRKDSLGRPGSLGRLIRERQAVSG
jgi:hypothetical protein